MMVTHSPLVNRLTTFSEKSSRSASDSVLLQAVLESWMDGVLLLTEQGGWVQANSTACRICDRLTQGQSDRVPEAIWRVCLALLQSRNDSSAPPIVFESEITVDETLLRVRVRWLNAGEGAHSYMLVVLEDRHQSTHNLARMEAARFNLTPRETKVWLLRRLGYTYGQIARELFITVDTVKKHMKNIRAKQQLTACIEECYSR